MIFNDQEFEVVGEGGAGIVFAYKGHRDIQLIGKVLRFRKSSDFRPKSKSDDYLYFYGQIMKRFLGTEYAVSMDWIPLTMAEMISFDQACRAYSRRNLSSLDLSMLGAIVMENLSPFLPNHFSFEIKPKWGFVYDSFEKACRYCRHQKYLVDMGEIGKTSQFCPLDLYSGDRERVKRALWSLFHGPHNNLIVKSGGKVIENPLSLPHCQQIVDILAARLCHEPLLHRLKRAQKYLDRFSIERIFSWWKERHLVIPIVWPAIFEKIGSNNKDDTLMLADSSLKVKNNTNNFHLIICEYLISTALKDCSILISLEPTASIDSQNVENVVWQGLSYKCSIKLIDLDIKEHHKIEKHWIFHQKLLKLNITEGGCSKSIK